jgi:hypothetical protein
MAQVGTPMIGNEFALIYDGSVCGMATDYSLIVNKKIIDTTTLSSGTWGDSKVGQKDWSVDFTGLVSRTSGDSSRGYQYIMTQFITYDTSIAVAICPSGVSGNFYLIGSGFTDSIKMQGGVGNKPVTFSGKVTGTGALNASTV